RCLIDEFEIASFDLSPRPFAEVLGEHGFDESGARLFRSCNAINAGEHFLRECDRSLLLHTTIIPRQERGPESGKWRSRGYSGAPAAILIAVEMPSQFTQLTFLILFLRIAVRFGIRDGVED